MSAARVGVQLALQPWDGVEPGQKMEITKRNGELTDKILARFGLENQGVAILILLNPGDYEEFKADCQKDGVWPVKEKT